MNCGSTIQNVVSTIQLLCQYLISKSTVSLMGRVNMHQDLQQVDHTPACCPRGDLMSASVGPPGSGAGILHAPPVSDSAWH